VLTEKIPTNYILGVAPGPARSHSDYPAFSLATRILSERLFEEVRTKRNLSYAVDAAIAPGRITQGVAIRDGGRTRTPLSESCVPK